MAWLKFDTSTPEKPEVFSITVAMGWDDPDLTVGKLMKVWRWFDQHTDGGNATGVTLALLDRVIGVTGFAQAMANVGWLIVTEAGLSLPNFDRHNGETAKTRAQTSKRVAKSKSNAQGNAKVTQTPLPNALPREEKIREEEITPIPPSGASRPAKTVAVSLPTWLVTIKAKGEKAIPEDDPVRTYAAEVGIPDELMRLAWWEFRKRYSEPDAKRYKDWRAVFRKAVRGNWLKLWYFDGNEYHLTTVGHQAEAAMGAEA